MSGEKSVARDKSPLIQLQQHSRPINYFKSLDSRNTNTRENTSTPPPPSPRGTNSSVESSFNSGAEGVKHKYPPHQSLVPPTLVIISTRCTSIIIKTVVVVTNNTNSTKFFALGWYNYFCTRLLFNYINMIGWINILLL